MKQLFIQIFLTSVLALFCLSGISFAEDAKPKSLADSWIVVPNAGQSEQFEAALKKHLTFRKQQGDTRQWHTYTPVIGKNLNYYVIRSCCTAWNDVDAYKQWGDDKEVGKHWMKNVDKFVQSYQHTYNRLDFENSKWDDTKKYNYFGVNRMTPIPGKGSEIRKYKKAISDNAKAMNWPFSWSWSWEIGGDENLILVFPYESYADMTPPEKPFATALGEHMKDKDKAMEILKNWSSSFSHTTYTVYAHREELSMKK
ncbi:hypothetical protein [Thalassotalea aquiviva]|uniref:hypothetical protein n=1 Tax=Thalassotalea aquiviva TaxID=3242415 RepID=UPI00352AF39E